MSNLSDENRPQIEQKLPSALEALWAGNVPTSVQRLLDFITGQLQIYLSKGILTDWFNDREYDAVNDAWSFIQEPIELARLVGNRQGKNWSPANPERVRIVMAELTHSYYHSLSVLSAKLPDSAVGRSDIITGYQEWQHFYEQQNLERLSLLAFKDELSRLVVIIQQEKARTAQRIR